MDAQSFTSRSLSNVGENWAIEASKATGYAATAAGLIGTGIELKDAYKNWKSKKPEFSQFDSGVSSQTDAATARAREVLIVDNGSGVSSDAYVNNPEIRAKMLEALNKSFQEGREVAGSIVMTKNDKLIAKILLTGNGKNVGIPSYELGFRGTFHTHFITDGPSNKADYTENTPEESPQKN